MKTSILVVEDEENIRTALTRWFELRGFDAEQACDGLEAVQMCDSKRYDIITMDLEMPRMNGVQAIGQIREKYPDIPIVVLTGYLSHTEESSLAGASRVLAKPMPLRELEKVVRELIALE